MGRPSTFTQETADAICERLANGESLRAICADEGMPGRTTILRWLGENEAFRSQYACAREAQADQMAEEIIEISDEESLTTKQSKPNADGEVEVEIVFDATAVARNRLRVDARKWFASKLAPKKYGDKIQQEHTGKDGSDLFANILKAVDGSALGVVKDG